MRSVGVVLLVSTLLAFCSCRRMTLDSLGTSTSATELSPEQLATCAEIMHVSFPESTNVIYYEGNTGLDDSIDLMVELKSKDVDTFLRHSPFKGKELSNDEKSVYGKADLSLWRAEETTKYLSGSVWLPDGEFLKILIDLEGDETVTIYLVWCET